MPRSKYTPTKEAAMAASRHTSSIVPPLSSSAVATSPTFVTPRKSNISMSGTSSDTPRSTGDSTYYVTPTRNLPLLREIQDIQDIQDLRALSLNTDDVVGDASSAFSSSTSTSRQSSTGSISSTASTSTTTNTPTTPRTTFFTGSSFGIF